ncbi:SDR family NAD(P)-dependent oxidoreductase [Halobacterium salinarum]|uniref:SDR family NAD(P)-dependent oxidoreductase n=1 Tax=Halobacterium salinarum TaxID=2242 RepID=UPI002552F406|nr:SDR family NAD(P)-dependent oxidoreductase [Halobacterium salinarum]MDL0131509.1 SDR family NAD(P)-dependent oxidoreductase [Halobacterium salinarum]
MIKGSNVLVTGGAGSVGGFLVRRILSEGPAVVRVFDNNEANIAQLKQSFDDNRLRYLTGDVRDKDRLARAINGIDIVVHTAALKHVDISEYNPFEAVKTNVVGLQNVVDAAIDSQVQRVVFTSSDKAVDPANTMGTTKLLGEKLITAGNKYKGRADLKLASVRFGNVINSSQSVVPVFREQIRNGGPVTITDERMTRFFLTWGQLGDLIIEAIEKTEGGEVFIYKMDAMRIEDLAEVMIDSLAPKYGYDPEQIERRYIGKRIGETIHEETLTDREVARTIEGESTYAIQPEAVDQNGYLTHDGLSGYSAAESVIQSSENAEKLNRDEIHSVLQENGALEVSQ